MYPTIEVETITSGYVHTYEHLKKPTGTSVSLSSPAPLKKKHNTLCGTPASCTKATVNDPLHERHPQQLRSYLEWMINKNMTNRTLTQSAFRETAIHAASRLSRGQEVLALSRFLILETKRQRAVCYTLTHTKRLSVKRQYNQTTFIHTYDSDSDNYKFIHDIHTNRTYIQIDYRHS